jgi:putative Ca2+/H+ antiporter (TMEM165/GDT1 family)
VRADEVAHERREPIMSTAGGAFDDRPTNHRKGLLERFGERKGLLNNRVLVAMLAIWSLGFLGVSEASAADLAVQVSEEAGNSGFVQSFLLIFASEIGDKTFFIAGLLAAKYSRLISLAGSIGALSVMTVISCIIGRVFHSLPPGLTQGLPLDDYAAVVAFAYFGIKTLYDAYQLPEGDSSGIEEEKKEAEEEVDKVKAEGGKLAAILQTFGLVFAAEVGDRSFFTTIALAAALNPFAVAFGAIVGPSLATGISVAGGSHMSKYMY